MYQTLRYEKQENIGILTINRPEALNALNSTCLLYTSSAAILFQSGGGTAGAVPSGGEAADAASLQG